MVHGNQAGFSAKQCPASFVAHKQFAIKNRMAIWRALPFAESNFNTQHEEQTGDNNFYNREENCYVKRKETPTKILNSTKELRGLTSGGKHNRDFEVSYSSPHDAVFSGHSKSSTYSSSDVEALQNAKGLKCDLPITGEHSDQSKDCVYSKASDQIRRTDSSSSVSKQSDTSNRFQEHLSSFGETRRYSESKTSLAKDATNTFLNREGSSEDAVPLDNEDSAYECCANTVSLDLHVATKHTETKDDIGVRLASGLSFNSVKDCNHAVHLPGRGITPESCRDVECRFEDKMDDDLRAKLEMPSSDNSRLRKAYLRWETFKTGQDAVRAPKFPSERSKTHEERVLKFLRSLRSCDIFHVLFLGKKNLQKALKAVVRQTSHLPTFLVKNVKPVEMAPLILLSHLCVAVPEYNPVFQNPMAISSIPIFYIRDSSNMPQSIFTVHPIDEGLYTIEDTKIISEEDFTLDNTPLSSDTLVLARLLMFPPSLYHQALQDSRVMVLLIGDPVGSRDTAQKFLTSIRDSVGQEPSIGRYLELVLEWKDRAMAEENEYRISLDVHEEDSDIASSPKESANKEINHERKMISSPPQEESRLESVKRWLLSEQNRKKSQQKQEEDHDQSHAHETVEAPKEEISKCLEFPEVPREDGDQAVKVAAACTDETEKQPTTKLCVRCGETLTGGVVAAFTTTKFDTEQIPFHACEGEIYQQGFQLPERNRRTQKSWEVSETGIAIPIFKRPPVPVHPFKLPKIRGARPRSGKQERKKKLDSPSKASRPICNRKGNRVIMAMPPPNSCCSDKTDSTLMPIAGWSADSVKPGSKCSPDNSSSNLLNVNHESEVKRDQWWFLQRGRFDHRLDIKMRRLGSLSSLEMKQKHGSLQNLTQIQRGHDMPERVQSAPDKSHMRDAQSQRLQSLSTQSRRSVELRSSYSRNYMASPATPVNSVSRNTPIKRSPRITGYSKGEKLQQKPLWPRGVIPPTFPVQKKKQNQKPKYVSRYFVPKQKIIVKKPKKASDSEFSYTSSSSSGSESELSSESEPSSAEISTSGESETKDPPKNIADIIKRLLPKKKHTPKMRQLIEETKTFQKARKRNEDPFSQGDKGQDHLRAQVKGSHSDYDMCLDEQEVRDLWTKVFPDNVNFWDRKSRKKERKERKKLNKKPQFDIFKHLTGSDWHVEKRIRRNKV